MSDPVQDPLVEALLSPHRSLDSQGRPAPPPAWWDLPPDRLEEVHRMALAARRLERALDPDGVSGTARAVLARIRRE